MCEEYNKTRNLPDVSEFFWQLLMEKEFLYLITSELAPSASVIDPTVSSQRKLTNVEENAIRYTAGFVIRKVENKYARKKTDEARQCVTALREMAGKLSKSQHHQHNSCEYINLIDRGGLYHIQDPVYDMFVTIELIVNEKLSALFSSKEDIKEMTRDKLSWVSDDEEVQLTWDRISPGTIEEKMVRQSLLKEIAYLWVTTRGYNKTSKIKDNHKQYIKGKKALRKE